MFNFEVCVCLGEFELKEELNQIPTCKHVFHIDCIRFWVLQTQLVHYVDASLDYPPIEHMLLLDPTQSGK
ncbi:hypothetical protein C3L33_16985, partial [Rhododendron williamsianum]